MRIAVSAALVAALFAGSALAQTAPAKPGAPHGPAQKSKAAPQKSAGPKLPPQPAKPTLAQLAAQGDVQAQLQLALAYQSGNGMPADAAQAATWFAAAANNGVLLAALELAKAYERGVGVPKSLSHAAEWWYRAGDLGDQAARERFVELYLNGDTRQLGGPAGLKWLEEAARSGVSAAILAIGQVYETGQGAVEADPALARRWYAEAALSDVTEGKFRLGRLLLAQPSAWRVVDKDKGETRFFAAKPTADQAEVDADKIELIRPGMVEGEAWLTEAARDGHAEAQYLLGRAYLNGMDLPFSLTEGLHWLEAAAWQGDGQALMAVADLAAKGQGFFAPDPVRAWVSYDLAAEEGVKPAEEARDRLGKTMNGKQLARARQLAQDISR